MHSNTNSKEDILSDEDPVQLTDFNNLKPKIEPISKSNLAEVYGSNVKCGTEDLTLEEISVQNSDF